MIDADPDSVTYWLEDWNVTATCGSDWISAFLPDERPEANQSSPDSEVLGDVHRPRVERSVGSPRYQHRVVKVLD